MHTLYPPQVYPPTVLTVVWAHHALAAQLWQATWVQRRKVRAMAHLALPAWLRYARCGRTARNRWHNYWASKYHRAFCLYVYAYRTTTGAPQEVRNAYAVKLRALRRLRAVLRVQWGLARYGIKR